MNRTSAMHIEGASFCVGRPAWAKLCISFCVQLWYNPSMKTISVVVVTGGMRPTKDGGRQGHAVARDLTSSLRVVHRDITKMQLLSQRERDFMKTATHV